MGKLLDLTGERFGSLSVLRRAVIPHRIGNTVKWVCACDCGKETVVFTTNLRRGNAVSCGCSRRENRETAIRDGAKSCQECGTVKPLDDFPRSARGVAGRFSYCRDCNRWRARKQKYGIDEIGFRRIVVEQGGTCANRGCGDSIDDSSHLDHCHATGAIRGILCNGCNTALGQLQERQEKAIGLAEYITTFPATARRKRSL